MISRLGLTLLLIVAGTLHLLRPELFDPAIPFDFKWEINLIAGFLEITLGLGLWIQKTRDRCAKVIALWFLSLIPIHLYVSYFQIPIFGLSHPLILWGRTLLQPLLFFWALSLQKDGWIISQRWSDVLFLNYEADSNELQKIVPYPLDLFEGKAVVSIVPFVMGKIRFPFLPSIPGLSRLYELNLRTYVRVNNRPAVYFLTLDSNHLIGVIIARLGFSLPYRFKSMKLTHRGNYLFESRNLSLSSQIDKSTVKSDFDRWITERYALVVKRSGKDLWGVVEHLPWELYGVKDIEIKDHFSSEFVTLKNFLGASYAKSLDVRFRPFHHISATKRSQYDKS